MENLAISLPIWICLLCYGAAAGRWLSNSCTGWADPVARFFWVLACAAFLVHVSAAFHFHYHWSHQQAFEATAQQSGFGPGIYISYAFTVLWAVDAAWALLAWRSYAARPPWLHWMIHLFTAFMLFNGAVVFAHGFSLVLGIAVFGFLALQWLRRRTRR